MMQTRLYDQPLGLVGTATEPLSSDQAAALLRAFGAEVARIVRVDGDHNPESVLYVDHAHRAMTAWLWRGSGPPIVRTEPGFAAEPAAAPEPAVHPILDYDEDQV